MPLPEVKQFIRNRGLGVIPDSATGTHVKIGCCSAGTANEVLSFNDKESVKAKLGAGPLVESILFHLETAGGPVLAVKAPSSTAGAIGALTPTATGTATLAASGAAFDEYDLVVQVVTGAGTLAGGGATFRYSLDGGRLWSAELAVPTSGIYLITEANITLTWTYTAGTAFVAGDKHTGSSTAPRSTQSEALAAVDAALADPTLWSWVHLVGPESSVATAVTLFTALETKLAGAEASLYRYVFGLIELPQDTDANIKTGVAAVAGDRVSACAGFAWVRSVLSYGRLVKRSTAWLACQRLASIQPGQDAAALEDGPLLGVVSLVRDEQKTPGLDDARLTTLRTFVGQPGFYLTNVRIKSVPGTDFEYAQHRRVMDVACAVNRQAMLRYLSARLRVDRKSGTILEKTARAIEADVGRQLESAVVDTEDASAVSVTVNRTDNILSEKVLRTQVAIVPHGYAKAIEATISFFNPALAAA
jgi:hypothetical protein